MPLGTHPAPRNCASLPRQMVVSLGSFQLFQNFSLVLLAPSIDTIYHSTIEAVFHCFSSCRDKARALRVRLFGRQNCRCRQRWLLMSPSLLRLSHALPASRIFSLPAFQQSFQRLLDLVTTFLTNSSLQTQQDLSKSRQNGRASCQLLHQRRSEANY